MRSIIGADCRNEEGCGGCCKVGCLGAVVSEGGDE